MWSTEGGHAEGESLVRLCTPRGVGKAGSDLITEHPASVICSLVNDLFASAVFSTLGDHLRFASIERTEIGSFLEEPQCSIIVKPQTS